MDQLRELLPGEPHFEHVCQRYSEGEKDPDWIPKLAADGNHWIVITSDGGKYGPHKLPVLCKQFGLHHKETHVKVGALLELWEQIENVRKAKPGSRFNLRYKQFKVNIGLKLVLEEKPDKG